MRRTLVALVLAMLVAAACSSGSDDGDGGGGGDGDGGGDGAPALPDCPVDALDSVDPADGKVEIVVWHSMVAQFSDTLTELTEQYNASQDKVEVRVENQADSNEAMMRKYTEAIPTGDLPDVVLADDPFTQFLADSGTILPAQACFDAAGQSLDDFFPTAVAYYEIDGAIQPGVLNIGSTLLYYNRQHFEAAGLDPDDPPETLDEMRTAAEAIKAAGVAEQPVSMALQPFVVEFWLTGAGFPVVDEDNGRAALATAGAYDNDGTHEVYDWLAGMQADGLLNAVSDTEGTIDHYLALAVGDSSMLPDTSTAATSVGAFLGSEESPTGVDIDPSEYDVTGLDIDAGVFPGIEAGGRGQVGGTAWYIVADKPPETIAAAWDYFTFMNSVDAQVTWNIDGSFTPWLQAAFDDPRLQEYWSSGRVGSWLETAAGQVRDIDPDFPGPLIGPYAEVRDAIRASLDQLKGGESPDAVIADANDEITDVVARYEEENF